jgi:thiazole synthase
MQEMLVDFIDPKKIVYLPNTAGCYTAEDAMRTLRLAREAGGWNLVKLEVLGDQKTLYPHMPETLRAAESPAEGRLRGDGLLRRRPDQAKRLEEMQVLRDHAAGRADRLGPGESRIRSPLRIIVENAKVPVLVDAGVGTASDAAVAMELGCDGVLMNTAIAEAKDPIRMAPR